MGNEREITIVVRADGTLAVKGLEQAGDAVKGVGDKASAAGQGGFRALGFASAKLAEDLGVPFRASHILGTRVEEIAKSTFPAWGLAMGGIGIAAVAVAGTISYFSAETKKNREEVEKESASVKSQMEAIYKNKIETVAMTEAKGNLYRALVVLNNELDRQSIKNNTEQIKEMRKELEGSNRWSNLLGQWKRILQGAMPGTSVKEVVDDYYGKLEAEIVVKEKELAVKKAAAAAGASGKINYGALYSNEEVARAREGLKAYQENIVVVSQLREQQDNLAGSLLNSAIAWDAMAKKTGGASVIMKSNEELIARAIQARGNISLAVNKSMEDQLMRLVETHRFSVAAIGQALMQAVKIELVAIAAKATVQALYFTAMGIAASSGPWGMATLGSPAAWFTAAGDMAMIAGASIAAAAAVNAVAGPGAQHPAAGANPSNPVYTSSGSEGTSSPAPQPAPTIQKITNIYVQGHLLDNDGLTRIMADAESRAEADNVYAY